ncbi:hypothetical protein NUW58_g8216 [Xylaria curta]|uniref:Uncharacterized protein n=1 Tax=Xylaria curta TaxID=42375 RepID=A0ACC1NBW1_9PEZI|nr:hypothetical protein NUW58_g8216 [Xylaria curta]
MKRTWLQALTIHKSEIVLIQQLNQKDLSGDISNCAPRTRCSAGAPKAFGVRDNEVLARAWCAHWGLNAVVADISKTCMACAIREAYAATLTVVILIEEQADMD